MQKPKKINSFNRSVLGEFMTISQLEELDRNYTIAKEKRKATRNKWNLLNPCPCCGKKKN